MRYLSDENFLNFFIHGNIRHQTAFEYPNSFRKVPSETRQARFILCPFHDDKEPSLKIYPLTNTFYCFSCGATGDSIQFIEMYEKLTKHQAIEKAKTLVDPLYSINTKPMEQARGKGNTAPAGSAEQGGPGQQGQLLRRWTRRRNT